MPNQFKEERLLDERNFESVKNSEDFMEHAAIRTRTKFKENDEIVLDRNHQKLIQLEKREKQSNEPMKTNDYLLENEENRVKVIDKKKTSDAKHAQYKKSSEDDYVEQVSIPARMSKHEENVLDRKRHEKKSDRPFKSKHYLLDENEDNHVKIIDQKYFQSKKSPEDDLIEQVPAAHTRMSKPKERHDKPSESTHYRLENEADRVRFVDTPQFEEYENNSDYEEVEYIVDEKNLDNGFKILKRRRFW
jgi:hypothetical protein